MSHAHHDFRLDTFDTVDGKHFLYAADKPDRRYEVVSLLDSSGDETDDPEDAAGGVVQLGEASFTTFTF
jgi:hypothetical protein